MELTMKRLPTLVWSETRLRVFAATTIAAAAVISFDSIRHLAERAGFGPLAWLFPLTLDAVAAYGMDLWVRQSPAMRSARALALSAIFGSLIANVADHWITQRSILGAVLGAVPPGMLAALLAVAHRHATGTKQSGPIADQIEQTQAAVDRAVRDHIWSSLPQAPRWTDPGPDRYLVPDRVLGLAGAGPVHGPWVGPMLAAPAVEYRLADRPLADLEELTKLDVIEPEPVRKTPRRISAARTTSPVRRTSAKVGDDAEIRLWIQEQEERPTKAAVMAKWSVGSGRALRLINEARGSI